jgi:hypothetical protein
MKRRTRQKIYAVLTILTVLTLSACDHETLKAPCSPTTSLWDSPCMLIPVNLASF